jgi:uncharacterized protein YsxB (DUF464 family)
MQLQLKGSFKIPQFDIITKSSRVGFGAVRGIERVAAKAVFLMALKAYVKATASWVPVLTGETKQQFQNILEEIQARMADLEGQYSWMAQLQNEDVDVFSSVPESLEGLKGISLADVRLKIDDTGRYYRGTSMKPSSRGADREYKHSVDYGGERVESRGEWRSAASGNTQEIYERALTLFYDNFAIKPLEIFVSQPTESTSFEAVEVSEDDDDYIPFD